MKRNWMLVFILSLFSTVHLLGACEPPFLLAVSNITTNSATLDWTPLGTETEWEVAVVAHGSPSPSLPTLSGILSHPVVHPGLASGKAYDFYVRPICDTIPGDWAKYNSFFITGLTDPSPCKMGLDIPDEGCIHFNVWVDGAPGTELGNDVFLKEVRVIMRHSWDDDLELSLIAPDGVVVDLSSDNGGNEDHYGDPNDPTCQSVTVFINELALGACSLTSITEGEAPFIGEYLPEEPLTLFNTGVNPNAVWKLRVCDDAGDDVGKLEFVELVFEPLICHAPTGVVVEGVDSTFADLDWVPGDSCLGTLIEYGPPGFTPGTGSGAGLGGTVFMAACPPFTLTGLLPETTYDLYIREACPNGGYTQNSCAVSLTTLCSPLPVTQSEDFNSETVCIGICSTPCDLTGLWANSRADDLDWLAFEGPTETPGTGPSDDFPGGGRYVYLEGSGACDYNDEAILYSHCMQIVAPPGSSCHFSFDYFMYGTAVHSLQLDITLDGGENWIPLWQLSGNQGEQWVRQFIDLSAYHGQQAQLRFVGKNGNNVRSDIGLDNLIFYGSIDQGAPAYVYYQDMDEDGYGNSEVYFASCSPVPPAGFATQGGDCFDLSDQISPGIPETPCDGFDINCNGMDDEMILPPPLTTSDTVCSGDFGLVEATAAYGGILIWYDVPVGGEPLDTNFFYLPNPPPFQTGDLPVTYSYYVEEVNFFGCATVDRGVATIIVLPQPELFIPEGQLEPLCAGDTVDLSGLIIQDLANSLATLTFHTAYPPTPANEVDPPVVNPLFTTTYYVLATAEGGCTDVDSVVVEIKDSPIAQIVGQNQLCKGASQVLQVVDVGNGIQPLEYVWSNASNATSIFVLASDLPGTTVTYTVTITDAGGCRSSDSFDMEIIGSITSVQVNEQDVSTCGGANGAINLNIAGGTAPFEISWDGQSSGTATSATSAYSITGLSQGTYSITVTDNSATPCPFVIPLAIVNGPQAQVSISSIQPVSCYGEMDGCIELQVAGVSPQIIWSTGDTTASVCNLDGGIYSVTVTDGACENILSGIVVQAPDSLTGKTAFLKNATCFGAADGEVIIVVGGGTSPFQYLWSNNATTSSLLGVGAGEYTVTITDDRGCQLVLGPNEVTEPPGIDLVLVETPVPCTDGVGGALEALVSGGAEPYGYLWTTGSNLPLIENLSPGTYGLTLTDLNGCSIDTSIVLENPPPLVIQITQSISPSCFGVADGMVEATVTGGLPPYTYLWSTGDTLAAVVLPAGEYGVTITDSSGCAQKLDGIALTAPNPVSVLPSITKASCLGKEDGQILLVPQNGQQPFTYLWEGGATGPVLSNLGAGAYAVTVTDANGCESDLTYTVGYNQPISATVTELGPNCYNGTNGKVFVTPMGGLPFYSYSWSTGQQTKDLLDVPSGFYVCTITDMNGCMLIIDTVELLNPPLIEIELLALDSISCFGMDDGAIDMAVSGGIPPYNYTWNTEETTQDLEHIGGGTYVLTVADALNCAVISQPVLIPEPSLLQLQAEAVDININCQANTLDTLFVQINGGSVPYQILWSTGQMDTYVLGSQPGDYSVTVTDAQGCVDSLTSLKVPDPVPFLTLNLSTNFTFSGDCDNPASTASLKATIQGGQAPFQYNWSSGVQGTTSSHTLNLTNLQEDTYSVTVTDAAGCVSVSNMVQVTFPDPLNGFVIGSSIMDVRCKGGNDGYIHPTVNGGAPPYQFVWMDQMGAPVGLSQNLDSIPAGIYTFQVIDQNECELLIPNIQVDEPDEALMVNLDVEDLACYGNNAGSIMVFPTGGSPLYTYSWNVPGNTAFQENLPAGIYALTVTDTKGCKVLLDSIAVLQPDAPLTLDTVIVSPILCNGVKDGAIDLEITGGTTPYNFIWSNGKLTEDIAGLGPGNYKCTIVDANGCQLVTPVFMLINPQVFNVVSITLDSATIGLSDGSIAVVIEGGTMPYTYLWSTGDTTATIDSLYAGNYVLTVTDANGCVLELQIYLPLKVVDGVRELRLEALRIYPNPVRETAWLELPPGIQASLDLLVRDALGQPVREQHHPVPPGPLLPIDLSDLPGGVYSIQVWSDGQLFGEALLVVIQ